MIDHLLSGLYFLMEYGDYVFAGVWLLGVIVVVYKTMHSWWREDASEIRIYMPGADDGMLYREMKHLGRQKRGKRIRSLLFTATFWPLVLAWKIGVGIAKVIFYPFLLAASASKEAAIEDARRNPVDTITPASSAPGAGVEVMECGKCGTRVTPNCAHRCSNAMICKKCGRPVQLQEAHSCDAGSAAPGIPCKKCGRSVPLMEMHSCEEQVMVIKDDDEDEYDVYR